jgi:catecholate siderophore receptor
MINLSRLALASSAAVAAFVWAAPALAEEAGEAPAIIVYGRPDGYDIEQTPTATKTQTPLVDVPQTVTVISREQLDDQGIESLGQALRFVPGVVLGQGEGHRDQVSLRGQSTTADFFVDGIRDDAQYYRPLYNIERVEVLKGANALIFGRGGGGGVINRVSKAPEFEHLRGSVAGGIDTFGAWSLAADLGAPLADVIGMRLNATYEAFNNHRQDYDGHFLGVTPTLGAHLGEATTLSLTYEYAEDRRLTDRGVPSLGGVPLEGYDKTLFGSPDTNRSEVTAHLAHARLDHEFSDSLSANLTLHYATYDKFYANIFAGSSVNASNQVTLSGYDSGTDRQNLIAQGNLVWKGEIGAIGHTLLLGFEAGDQDTEADRHNATFPDGASVTLAPRLTLPAILFPALSTASRTDVRTLSGYIQDQLDIGQHVKLVAGLRYDHFRIAATNLVTAAEARRSDGKWSPRLGLILKPRENVSVYTSYAISFLPQSGDQFTTLDATQATLAPEKFENLEAGVKWDVSEALAFTLAAYRLDRTNSRFNDPVTGTAPRGSRPRWSGR